MKKHLLLLMLLLTFFIINAQWQQTVGLSVNGGSLVNDLLTNGTDLFAGTVEEIYLTHDSGSSWIIDTAGFNIPTHLYVQMSRLCVMGNTLITFGDTLFVYHSVIGVNYWTKVSQLTYFHNLGTFAVIDSNLFAGGNGGTGLLVSLDTGRSWTVVACNGLGNNHVLSLTANGTSLYAATTDGVYFSNNKGLNWDSAGLYTHIVSSFAIHGNNLYAGTHDGLYHSSNNGLSWSEIDTGLTIYSHSINTFAFAGNKIFIGTASGGVFVSTNNGASWTTVNNGLTSLNIYKLAIVGNNLFAGTGCCGVFKAAINDLTGIDEIPFTAQQVNIFPNPFISQTTITFSEEQKNTTIKIADILGKEIKTTNFSGKLFTINRGELSNGIYLVQLTDDKKNVLNKKIIVQ